ncbi:MAG: NAD+ synthase [Candidatus Omnitrophota bacterium]
MKVALLQLNMTVGDIEGNSAKIIAAVKNAQTNNVDLCISAELALLGYPPRDLLLNHSFIQSAQEAVDKISQDINPGPALLLGTISIVPEIKGKPLYNSALLINQGKVQNAFHKSLLPAYDVFDEERYFEPAKKPGFFELKGVKIGVTICEDIWNHVQGYYRRGYHEDPLAIFKEANIGYIINLSSSPFAISKQKLRESMLKNIAQQYAAYVIYVNQIGGNDDLVFDGGSCIIDKQGNLLARAKRFVEETVIYDFTKITAPVTVHTTQTTHECKEEAEAYKALVLGTRDYVRKCGFTRVVLGLSGGIDSALTAAIAVDALGADNVLGVLMPSPYSSQGSIDDSLKLADNLGIKTSVIKIEPVMKAFDAALKKSFQGVKPDLTEENIQARIRGNLLMALSNKYKSLLLTTGNKSELSVGYCTIYGDMSGGFAVIADVPKTLVYKIANYINQEKGKDIIPQEIIKKAPSAELRPDQKDQDSLPDYDVLDKILFHCIQEHKSAQEIIDAGFEPEKVLKVLRLVKNAEFKRRQLAPGVKITDQAFGTGWRMPIACKRNF